MFLKNAQAQLFHPKDSVRKQRILQVGLGGFTGVNKVIPTSNDFFYGNADGLEFGFLGNVYLNVTKHVYIQLGYRISNKSAMINHGNDVFYESFILKQSGSSIPVMIHYKIHHKLKSLFDLGIGVAYGKYISETDDVYGNLHPPGVGVTMVIGSNYMYGQEVKGISYIFACSKTMQLNKLIALTLFAEFEWVSPQIEVLNSFNNGTNTGIEFWTIYQTYLYRVGTVFKF